MLSDKPLTGPGSGSERAAGIGSALAVWIPAIIPNVRMCAEVTCYLLPPASHHVESQTAGVSSYTGPTHIQVTAKS